MNKICMGIWGMTNLRDRFNVDGFKEDDAAKTAHDEKVKAEREAEKRRKEEEKRRKEQANLETTEMAD